MPKILLALLSYDERPALLLCTPRAQKYCNLSRLRKVWLDIILWGGFFLSVLTNLSRGLDRSKLDFSSVVLHSFIPSFIPLVFAGFYKNSDKNMGCCHCYLKNMDLRNILASRFRIIIGLIIGLEWFSMNRFCVRTTTFHPSIIHFRSCCLCSSVLRQVRSCILILFLLVSLKLSFVKVSLKGQFLELPKFQR